MMEAFTKPNLFGALEQRSDSPSQFGARDLRSVAAAAENVSVALVQQFERPERSVGRHTLAVHDRLDLGEDRALDRLVVELVQTKRVQLGGGREALIRSGLEMRFDDQ